MREGVKEGGRRQGRGAEERGGGREGEEVGGERALGGRPASCPHTQQACVLTPDVRTASTA